MAQSSPKLDPQSSCRTPESCLKAFGREMKKNADPDRAEAMARYMKSRFRYFGISSTERNLVFKPFRNPLIVFAKKGHLETIMLQSWAYDQREMQYCGLEILFAARKAYSAETIDLIEKLILNKSWWDTVDLLASKAAGHWFSVYPEEKTARIDRWTHHPDMWLNRSAILHQLAYKETTDFELMKKTILPHIHSKEFFLRKAIGWALRQYSRVNPQAVLEFVKEHDDLSGLSKKEALRLIK